MTSPPVAGLLVLVLATLTALLVVAVGWALGRWGTGRRLTSDADLAHRVNLWIADGASYAVRTYRSEIAGVISETVGRWDAEETSRKIELQVGRDLQFIRINGTVVGALAGLAIFTLATLLFG